MTAAASVPMPVRALCVLSALVCALIALAAIAGGPDTAANLGFAFARPAGQVEFLTFYGGFYLGLAVFFLIGMRAKPIATGAMAFLALGNAGALLGRLGAMVALGTSAPTLVGLAVGELVLAGLGVWGWRIAARE